MSRSAKKTSNQASLESMEPRLLLTATFTDVTASLGLPSTPADGNATYDSQYLHACAWGDVNGDGYPDLFYGAFSHTVFNPAKPDLPATDGIDRLFIFNPATGQYEQSFQTSINGATGATNFGRTSGATFADFDNDGDLDLIVSRNWRNGVNNLQNQLLRNDGTGIFTDVTAGSGVADTTMSGRNAFVLDYNGDGKLDILLQDDQFGATKHSRLMRNDTVGTTGPLVFTEVTVAAGIDNDETGIGGAVGDINGDSWPDFVNVGWNSSAPATSPRPPEVTVYINNQDGTFHKSTTFDFSGAYPWGTAAEGWNDLGEDWASGATIGDLNGDGIMDMVLGEHYGDGHYGAKQMSVLVFLGTGNDISGDPQWVDATTASGVAASALFSKMPTPDIQDFDNDGKMDIWTASSINDDTDTQTPYILYNSGNSGTLGGVPVPHFAAAANLDSPANSYENFPGQSFAWQPNSRDRYNARYYIGGPTTDSNHDGLLDIFVAEAFNYDHYSTVWQNNTVTSNHWLEVQVNTTADGANRFGIGAVVQVYEAGHSGDAAFLLGMGANEVANGFTSSRPAIVHFGLGNYSGNVDVVVTMPGDGDVYARSSVTADQLVTMGPLPPNTAPVATGDSYSAHQDQDLSVDAPGVLANDTDIDGDPLTATLGTDVTHGTLDFYDDGSFTYTPDAGYTGPDSFTYTANDGTVDSNVATVTINVAAGANTAPVAVDDSYTIRQGQDLTVDAPGVLTNDTDADGDPLTAHWDSDPSHGSLSLNADGSFDYTPDSGYSGTDTFTYTAYDGTDDSNIATVTITITADSIPVAADDSYNAHQDQDLVVDAPGVMANDTDADGDPLTAALDTDVTHGTLNLNDDGSFTYTPDSGYSGPDSFTYTVNDGTVDSNVATVTINVASGVNAVPVATDDSYSANQDQDLIVDAPGVLSNDTDADGDPLIAHWVSDPSHGSLSLNDDGSFTYTPDAGYNGPDSFTYTAYDGTDDSNVATVAITVLPNAAPTATDDSYNAHQDQTLTVDAPGVLANDTDPEGDWLTANLVADVSHGTLTFNGDGSFDYTPNTGYVGSDSFTYTANDGTSDSNVATVTITTSAGANADPVAVDDSYSVGQDQILTVDVPGVLTNDTDANGDPLTTHWDSDPSHGWLDLHGDGSFTYVPDPGYSGSDSFTYTAFDGTGDSNIATVTINVVANATPVAADDSYNAHQDQVLTVDAPGVLANDTDADGDPLTANLGSDVSHGTLTLNTDGSFTYTPDAGYSGPDSFTYSANDGTTDSNIATVTISVAAGANTAPVAADDSYSVSQGQILTVVAPGILGNDTDADGDPLSAHWVSDPSHGTLSLGTDGSFIYTPAVGYSGPDSFTYTAFDGTADSNIATVTIDVGLPDVAPVAVDDAYSANQDISLSVAAPGVLLNDTDADGDPLTAVLISDVSHGLLAFNPDDGSFIYTPAAGYSGPDSFTYQAYDGAVYSNTATVTISVAPTGANAVPVAVADSYTTPRNTLLTVDAPGVLLNDTDADGDPLTALIVGNVSHGTLSLGTDGSFSYMPNAGYSGPDSFMYRVYDGTDYSSPVTVTLGVDDAPNAAPVGVVDNLSVNEDGTLTVPARGVLTNDTDADGDPLTAVLLTGVSHGSLTLNANGSLTYTPNANYHGSDSFTYRAYDGLAYSSPTTVNITVVSVNDAPTISTIAPFPGIGNQDLTFTYAQLASAANAFDVDGDVIRFRVDAIDDSTLTFTKNGSPVVPGVTLIGPGDSIVWHSKAGESGLTDAFVLSAWDGKAASANSVEVQIDLNNAPTMTVVAPLPGGIEDQDFTITYAALFGATNAIDIDGDAISFLITSISSGTLTKNGVPVIAGQDTISAGESLVWHGDADDNGTIDAFTIVASDGALQSSPDMQVQVVVAPVEDLPVFTSVPTLTGAKEDLAFANVMAPILASASDADDEVVSFRVESLLAGRLTRNGVAVVPGTTILRANDSVVWTPPANANGDIAAFTLTAFDGTGSSTTPVTVTVHVVPVNDRPTAEPIDPLTADEATPLLITLSGSDVETPADSLVFNVPATTTGGGTLVRQAAGQYLYTPAPYFNGADSFSYSVTDTGEPAGVNARTSVATTVNITVGRSYTFQAGKPFIFTDSDGDTVTVTLSQGSAVIRFPGETSRDMSGLSLLGTTAATKLTIAAKSHTRGHTAGTTVHSISADGDMASITGKAVQLTGDLSVAGRLGTATFLRTSGGQGTITLGGSTGAVTTLKLGSVVNKSIVSTSPLSLTASEWVDDDPTADMITAPMLTKLAISGRGTASGNAFQAGLNLTSTGVDINSVTLPGSVSNANWTLAGRANKVTIRGSALAWNFTAASIGTLAITGSYSSSALTLTSAVPFAGSKAMDLSKLTVGGQMLNVDVRSAGNVGTVTTGSMLSSRLYAGVKDGQMTLPAPGDFNTLPLNMMPSIAGVTIRGTAITGFSDSQIAAMRLGKVVLKNVLTDTPGTTNQFGLSAGSIASYTRQQNRTTAYKWAAGTVWPTDNHDDFQIVQIF